jgi:hypothetical protein
MELLLIIIISGMAVGFTTEAVGALVERFTPWGAPTLKGILSAPLAALFCWILGVSDWTLLVASLAAGFISLIIMRWVNRPVQIQQVMSRRLQ